MWFYLAQELSPPNSLGYALDCTAMCHQLRREPRETQGLAEATIKLGIEHGFPYWETQGTILRGAALAEQGREEEGLTQMRQGLTAHWAIGGRILEQYWLALQVEAYRKIGRIEEAFDVLTEALAVAEKNGECFWEAELYRLKGELLLAQKSEEQGAWSKERRVRSKERGVGSKEQEAEMQTHPRSLVPDFQDEVEGCFLKAIEIARNQQAKSLELRATMSLARLWQQQGKHAEAHTVLCVVYNWFTEGFDTKDLQESKALLDDLMSVRGR